jgi:23S rRNA (adenine1618-N6)-methyltransferase
MHSRNKHSERYDFTLLTQNSPELAAFVFTNQYGSETIDFANPEAVKILNRALLKTFYGVNYWDIPKDYLCPPIPGRADYIHSIADLLSSSAQGEIPQGESVVGLDIGTGANCIYPMLGVAEYGWSFLASEIDPKAYASALKIIQENGHLKNKIFLKLQSNPAHVFQGILKASDVIDFTLCNPPFHTSAEEAQRGSKRKMKNLGLKTTSLNFGGQGHELWCPGGEKGMILKMIEESRLVSGQSLWFTSLVSKQEHLSSLQKKIKSMDAKDVRVIEMTQGQKVSRILAWSFFSQEDQRHWAKKRWKAI